MKKHIVLFSHLLCLINISYSQNNILKQGYLLKGNDTIRCSVSYNPENPAVWNNVKAIINNQENIFRANESVTGFGVMDSNINIHFGSVLIKNRNGMNNKYLFVKKLLTGVVELYEHHYEIYSTQRGTMITTKESYTDYYIANKHISSYSSPLYLRNFKKKKILPYISDNKQISGGLNEIVTLSELIELLNYYNKGR